MRLFGNNYVSVPYLRERGVKSATCITEPGTGFASTGPTSDVRLWPWLTSTLHYV